MHGITLLTFSFPSIKEVRREMHCRTVLVPSLFFVILKIVRIKKKICIGQKIYFMFLLNNQLDTQFLCMFICILYMFRAAMCPSSGELVYQCNTWFMSLCIDDRLVCRLTCIPDGHLHISKNVENRNKRHHHHHHQ